MTKAERELQAIRHKLTEWEWKVALAIFKIPPRRLITYRSLSILATGTDANRAAANLRQSLTPPLEAPPHRGLRTTTPEDRASDLARPSACSTGARRRVKEDPGGMTDHPEYTITPPPTCPTKWDHLSSSDQLVLTLMAGQTFPSTVISYSTTRSTRSWGTKKKPYRYRWPDENRDEVLARLLTLTLWDRRDD